MKSIISIRVHALIFAALLFCAIGNLALAQKNNVESAGAVPPAEGEVPPPLIEPIRFNFFTEDLTWLEYWRYNHLRKLPTSSSNVIRLLIIRVEDKPTVQTLPETYYTFAIMQDLESKEFTCFVISPAANGAHLKLQTSELDKNVALDIMQVAVELGTNAKTSSFEESNQRLLKWGILEDQSHIFVSVQMMNKEKGFDTQQVMFQGETIPESHPLSEIINRMENLIESQNPDRSEGMKDLFQHPR